MDCVIGRETILAHCVVAYYLSLESLLFQVSVSLKIVKNAVFDHFQIWQ